MWCLCQRPSVFNHMQTLVNSIDSVTPFGQLAQLWIKSSLCGKTSERLLITNESDARMSHICFTIQCSAFNICRLFILYTSKCTYTSKFLTSLTLIHRIAALDMLWPCTPPLCYLIARSTVSGYGTMSQIIYSMDIQASKVSLLMLDNTEQIYEESNVYIHRS